MALQFRQDSHLSVFYPFLLRKIPYHLCDGKEMFDMQTPYGYGGPFFCNNDQACQIDFSAQLHQWCLLNKVVAEFVRYNPLLQSNPGFYDLSEITFNRLTVVIDLCRDPYRQTDPAKRRNIRRAEKEGLTLCQCDGREFLRLYRQTMQRNHADRYYFFSDDYFNHMFNYFAASLQLRGVQDRHGRLIAAGIFFDDGVCRHYHLGGSDPDYLALRPNDFLIFQTACEAQKNGLKIMHLGGGRRADANDELFRFKKGFSQTFKRFMIGKFIHQPQIYAAVSEKWQQLTGKKPDILLHYYLGEP